MKGGYGVKNDGPLRFFRLKARLGLTAPRFLLFSLCQNFLLFHKTVMKAEITTTQ